MQMFAKRITMDATIKSLQQEKNELEDSNRNQIECQKKNKEKFLLEQQVPILKNSKKIKNDGCADKKIIMSKQIRKEMTLFEHRRKKLLEFNDAYLMEQCFYHKMTSAKKFLLIGGVFIELMSYEDDQCIDKLHIVKRIHKYMNGSVLISSSMRQAQHDYDFVIYILQKTQNQEDYDLSQSLIQVKQSMFNLRQKMFEVKRGYDPIQFEKLLQLRREYAQQYFQKKSQMILNEEEFGVSILNIFNWDVQLNSSKELFMSNQLISMIGIRIDDFIFQVLRNSYMYFFTQRSRCKLLKKVMITLFGDIQNISFSLDEVQIKLIDEILITCSLNFYQESIEFPPELAIKYSDSELLNSRESITTIKFDISPYHLEKIAKIRNQQKLEQQQNPDRKEQDSQSDGLIIKSFDYYMQSQVFFEKFYQNNKNEEPIEQVEETQNRCSYRLINPNQCHTQQQKYQHSNN